MTAAPRSPHAEPIDSGSTLDAIPDFQSFGHDPEAKRKVLNRLKRAQGQLAAVIDAVDGDGDCREVVQQLSAVSKALDRAGFLVISSSLRECLSNPAAPGSPNPDELEKLFLSLA